MENITKFRPNPEAKLMDQVKDVLKYHRYAFSTVTTYCQWILRSKIHRLIFTDVKFISGIFFNGRG